MYANKGTSYLDELAELARTLSMAKLLHVLQGFQFSTAWEAT
jgi:transcriptional regulator with PAS, ATPase and Fis domain